MATSIRCTDVFLWRHYDSVRNPSEVVTDGDAVVTLEDTGAVTIYTGSSVFTLTPGQWKELRYFPRDRERAADGEDASQ